MSRCRAVIFDLDGTLLDTLDDIADAANAALRRFGLPPHPRDDYRRMVGDGMALLARRALPEGAFESCASEWIEEVKREFRSIWPRRTRPYDGIPELLDALVSRGLLLAILSNRPEDLARMMVREMLGRWRFEAIEGAGADGPPKPDPARAFAIAKAMGLAPEACAFLGDSDVDMKAASAAGMLPVGALWGFRGREELVASGAKILIERPGDLIPLVVDRP